MDGDAEEVSYTAQAWRLTHLDEGDVIVVPPDEMLVLDLSAADGRGRWMCPVSSEPQLLTLVGEASPGIRIGTDESCWILRTAGQGEVTVTVEHAGGRPFSAVVRVRPIRPWAQEGEAGAKRRESDRDRDRG